MPEKSRTYNSITNSIVGIASSLITVVMNFFVRVILVRELGEEINGLHNLFQGITNVMILMELGISSAMVIHLYEPIKKKDYELTRAIMSFYKKIYICLAIVFTMVSLLVSFFLLESMVTTTIPMYRVRIYFLVFTISFTFNYLTYYKRSILFAEQKNRISTGVTAGCEVLFRLIQIVLILVFHEYTYFLIATILMKVVSNKICDYYVSKNHPYLRHNNSILSKTKRKAIFATVRPLLVNQLANTAQQSSRSILISILLGNVAQVGYYGNYQLLLNVAQNVYSQFGGSFGTSFGNLSVDGDKMKMHSVYYKSAFIMNWMACICCAAFISGADDFIYLVFGPHFVISHLSVFVLALDLAVYLLDIPMISVQNAMGLHRYDAKLMVVQAIFAISLGYVGGKYLGMAGIFLGLLIPVTIFTLFGKGIIIGKKALDMQASSFLLFIGIEISKLIITMLACYGICSFICWGPSFMSLATKIFIALIVGICLPGLMSYKTKQFKETIQLVSKISKRKK